MYEDLFKQIERIDKDNQDLHRLNTELTDRCALLGRQIVEMKNAYDELKIEIEILKEGGNL